jgi:hypothetical protein
METGTHKNDAAAQFALDNNLPSSIPAELVMAVSESVKRPKLSWMTRQAGRSFYRIAFLPSDLNIRMFQGIDKGTSTYIDTLSWVPDTDSDQQLTLMQRREFKAEGEVHAPIYDQRRLYNPMGHLISETVSEMIPGSEVYPNTLLLTRYCKIFPRDNAESGMAYGTMYYASGTHYIQGANGEIISVLNPASNLIVTQNSSYRDQYGARDPAKLREIANNGLNYLRASFDNPYRIKLLASHKAQLAYAQSSDLLAKASEKFPEALGSGKYLRLWSSDEISLCFDHRRFGRLFLPREMVVNARSAGISLKANFSL